MFIVYRHGLYRSEILIYGDPTLSFKETVPTSTLFTEPVIKELGGKYNYSVTKILELKNGVDIGLLKK